MEQIQLDSGYYAEVPTGMAMDAAHTEDSNNQAEEEGQCKPNTMFVKIRHEKEVHEWEVCPHDTVQILQLFVHYVCMYNGNSNDRYTYYRNQPSESTIASMI